jgi:YjbE family integral membrane protein
MTIDAEFFLRALGIVAIDLTVAGDNALVIALAVRSLPAHQQRSARLWGAGGAVALRVLCIFVASYLLRLPLLQAAGGLALIWLAISLVRQHPGEGGDHQSATSWWGAIWMIVVADAAMSIDNVLAVVAAAHGNFPLALFGVALSIPVVVWGSGLVAWLLGRYPWIVAVGGAILGYVAGEMIVADDFLERVVNPDRAVRIGLPLVLAAVVAVIGWRAGRPARRAAAERQAHHSRGPSSV